MPDLTPLHLRTILVLLVAWGAGCVLLVVPGHADLSPAAAGWSLAAILCAWFAATSGGHAPRTPATASAPSDAAEGTHQLHRIFEVLVRESSPDAGAESALVHALEQHADVQAVRVSLVDHDETEIEMASSNGWSARQLVREDAPPVLQFALPDWGSNLSYRLDVLPSQAVAPAVLRQEIERLAPLLTAHLNGLAALRETELARIALRQANRQIDATRKRILAQERTALLGRLIANMAHELNNPILGIQGSAAVLERTLTDDAPLQMVRTILAECRRCTEILGCVISLGDEETPARRAVRLDDTITQALSLLRYKARQAEVRIEHVHPSNTPTVLADPVLLRQAMLNLLEGLLRDLEGADAPRQLAIDTQPGMDHVRVRIRTSPLGAATTGAQTATTTKLALWVTEAVIESLGGHFEAVRRAGEGAAVDLLVPLRPHLSAVEKDLQATMAAPSIPGS